MKIIMCQPANLRFEWELKVALTNLSNLGYNNVILLMLKEDPIVLSNLKEAFPKVEIFSFDDNREDKSYIPSIKPYLWYRFLSENPSYENEDYLYIDSDVIFREMIDYKQFMEDDVWYGSNCSSYLDTNYVLYTDKGSEILECMCRIVGIKPEQAMQFDGNYIGAQLIVKKPKASFWHKVYEDSIKIWHYLEPIQSNIQKWTAEMWAQCYNMIYFNIKQEQNSEFDFTWATDSVENWYKNKIFHNAGVSEGTSGLFFKGEFIYNTPFNTDLSFVSNQKAQYFYIKAIENVKK